MMNIKELLYKRIPPQYKFFILRCWFLINNPKFIFCKYKDFLNEAKPILVVSLPRSGSSWVGKVLGSGERALYLREPITRTYLLKNPEGQSVFTIDSIASIKTKQNYLDLIETTFTKHPNFTSSVIAKPKQWFSNTLNKKRVIKEVNPLILEYILDKYKPKVIYLYRHPAAIANSHYASGWARDAFEGKFSPDQRRQFDENYNTASVSGFWESFGKFQGIQQKLVCQTLKDYDDKLLVSYEKLCENPKEEFEKIFKFSELPLTSAIEQDISASTRANNKTYRAGTYDTQRNSKAMIKKWITQVDTADLEKLKAAYLSTNPEFYKNELDWK
ncbi:sulfotransferase domain-containing protein [Thalassotalea agariperforans]